MRVGEPAPPFTSCITQKSRSCTSSKQQSRASPDGNGCRRPDPKGISKADRLNNSATTQAHIQDLEQAHSTTYLMDKRLQCVNGLVLQNQSYKISTTQKNKGIFKESQ